jgi:hypothetical protein
MNQHVFMECNAHFPTYYSYINSAKKVVFEIEMGCHQAVIRQSSDSHQEVIRQSSGSHQAGILMCLILSGLYSVLHNSNLEIKTVHLQGFWPKSMYLKCFEIQLKTV